MSYTKTTWVNNDSPAISAANLQNIEDGIETNDTSIGDLTSLNTSVKDTLVNAINEVSIKTNNIVGSILWSDYNTSTISTPTNITLESDDYDFIRWYYAISTNNQFVASVDVPKGYDVRLMSMYGTGSGVIIRPITRNSDTSYTIGVSTATADTNVPILAMGYKTGLFVEDDENDSNSE